MTIASVPPDGPFLLKFVTRFDPGANLELSGLYRPAGRSHAVRGEGSG